jgi:sirohydrochlorin cobaltochelatase
MRGLILLAHGARDPGWAAPFESVAERLRALQPGLHVRLAFLEFMAPTLGDALTELAGARCVRVDVLPMFLGTGGHVRRDLPRLLAAGREAHPALEIELHASIGEMPAVAHAMAEAISQQLRQGAR